MVQESAPLAILAGPAAVHTKVVAPPKKRKIRKNREAKVK